MTQAPGGLVQSDLDPFYNEVEYDYEFLEQHVRLRLTPSLADHTDLNGKKHSFMPANFEFSEVGFPEPVDLVEQKIEIYHEVLVEKVTYVIQQDGDRDEVSRQKEVYYPEYSISAFEFDFDGAALANDDYDDADTSLWCFTGPQPYVELPNGQYPNGMNNADNVPLQEYDPALLEISKEHVFDFTNATSGNYTEDNPVSVSIKQGAQIKYWRLFTKNRGSYIPRQTRIIDENYKKWAQYYNSGPYEVYFRGIDAKWPGTPSNPQKGIYPYRKVNQIKPDQRYVLKARFKLKFRLNPSEGSLPIDIIRDTSGDFSARDCEYDIYLPVTHPKGFDWKGYKEELNANGEEANGIEVGNDRYNPRTDLKTAGPWIPIPPDQDPDNPKNYPPYKKF